MFMFWFFTLYIYALSHDIELTAGAIFIMAFYALISDLLLYSLASQWVKGRQNVSRPIIHKIPNPDRDSSPYRKDNA